ncbi:MAG: hypothetical protein GXY61_02530 [Lentisphaerae bacterium]|jgi:D-beta-D-heptose 7-phosphate kinase/D-beta-D-heptose 1-phosphate adenosyltransferase|nr:hypothetical protein [Lentisphaerota bacterium]
MHAIISNFSNKHVLVIGDVMMDIYDFCHTGQSRPSPEKKDARVYRAERQLKALGGAGNVAANCVALSAQTTMIGICGQDAYSFEIEGKSSEMGIRHVMFRDERRPTTVKTRLYIDEEYILRRDDESTEKVDDVIEGMILSSVESLLPTCDVVILSDYNKGIFTESGTQAIISMCRKKSVPVVVDFKPENRNYFRGASIIVPNLVEARNIMPDFKLENLSESCNSLYASLSAMNLVVTLGGEGICGYDGNVFFRYPARKVNVVDPVGCGDTVRAVLALAFTSGLSLEQSAEMANRAASIAVQKIGTAIISAEELKKEMR